MDRGGDFLVVPSCRELSKNNAHDELLVGM